MSLVALTLSQVAAEYGTLAARDGLLSLQRTVSNFGAQELVIGAAVLMGLYLLVKLM